MCVCVGGGGVEGVVETREEGGNLRERVNKGVGRRMITMGEDWERVKRKGEKVGFSGEEEKREESRAGQTRRREEG